MSVRFEAKETKKRGIVARLLPGTELIAGIKAICARHKINAGAITSILGSMGTASYTYIVPSNGRMGIKYREPIRVAGAIEIICGAGFIGVSKDSGELFVHLHLSMCDETGKTFGGHITEDGNAVAVTAEILIEAFEDVSLSRAIDEETEMPLFSIGV